MQNKFYTIGHLEIPQRIIMDTPLWYLDNNNKDGISKKFKELKKISGYTFDNTHLHWSNIFGHMFSISIHLNYKKTYWDVHVWNHTGNESILNFLQKVVTVETDVLSIDNYKKLCGVTENYVRGIIKCSGCGKEIKTTDVAGQYFAGRYCNNCWNNKYKAIEAAENYE